MSDEFVPYAVTPETQQYDLRGHKERILQAYYRVAGESWKRLLWDRFQSRAGGAAPPLAPWEQRAYDTCLSMYVTQYKDAASEERLIHGLTGPGVGSDASYHMSGGKYVMSPNPLENLKVAAGACLVNALMMYFPFDEASAASVFHVGLPAAGTTDAADDWIPKGQDPTSRELRELMLAWRNKGATGQDRDLVASRQPGYGLPGGSFSQMEQQNKRAYLANTLAIEAAKASAPSSRPDVLGGQYRKVRTQVQAMAKAMNLYPIERFDVLSALVRLASRLAPAVQQAQQPGLEGLQRKPLEGYGADYVSPPKPKFIGRPRPGKN